MPEPIYLFMLRGSMRKSNSKISAFAKVKLLIKNAKIAIAKMLKM